DLFGEEVGEQYDSLAALEGPDGHQDYTKISPSVWDTANFIVTSENENPEAAVRWMDYFYSEEGAKLYYMGVEGETYEEKDGDIQYMDHITDPDDDMTFEQAVVQQLTWVGSISGIIRQIILLEENLNHNRWKLRKKLNHIQLMKFGLVSLTQKKRIKCWNLLDRMSISM